MFLLLRAVPGYLVKKQTDNQPMAFLSWTTFWNSLGSYFPSSLWPNKFDAVVKKRPFRSHFCPESSGRATGWMQSRLL